ncbi:MAG: hypothetical protein NT121_07845 [Chloroflexi bacterium]|nr:hypothetical protein [Chloroflexota bacterium]
MGRTLMYVGAGILFLMGLCLVGYGALNVVGSTSAQGDSSWLSFGIGFLCLGLVFLGSGAGLVWVGARKTGSGDAQVIQQVVNIDLPGDTKISQMKCQSCGGAITSSDIKMMAGAPVVTCPYCQATYQLTEEPKW